MTVRFIGRDHDVRRMKDAVSRKMLTRLEEAEIGIASAPSDHASRERVDSQNER